MRQQEINCFLEVLKVPAHNLNVVNLPYQLPKESLFNQTDVILVGGAGDYSILEVHPWLPPFCDFLCQVCELGFPMFASCFGFHALCVALGGKVISDPRNAEVGTYEVHLTEEGKLDPLFGQLPEKYFAQMGHKDRARNCHQRLYI